MGKFFGTLIIHWIICVIGGIATALNFNVIETEAVSIVVSLIATMLVIALYILAGYQFCDFSENRLKRIIQSCGLALFLIALFLIDERIGILFNLAFAPLASILVSYFKIGGETQKYIGIVLASLPSTFLFLGALLRRNLHG